MFECSSNPSWTDENWMHTLAHCQPYLHFLLCRYSNWHTHQATTGTPKASIRRHTRSNCWAFIFMANGPLHVWRTVIWSKKGLRYSGLCVPFSFHKWIGIGQTKLKIQTSSWKLSGTKHAHPTYKDTVFGQWCLPTAEWHPGKIGAKKDGSWMKLILF